MLAFGKVLPISLGFALTALASVEAVNRRPNVVFILTDDQDVHMNSLDFMPLTQKYLVNEGTTFGRHYCTVAICCPSRVNLWTGQLAHNTNVTDVTPPYGGYPKFVSQGLNEDHLALWMQKSGYNTYYVGKLFNAHTVDNYNIPPVSGYTGSDFLLDPFTYQYLNVSMTRNGAPPVNYLNQYSPDLTAKKAYGFLEDALEDEKPFFLTIAPVAPHADVELYPTMKAGPPKYADRHAHLFKDYKIPRSKNFNPDVPSGVSWISKLQKLNDTVIEYNDEYQRSRLRALQSVDEMVEELVHRLESAGALANTYIFYSSDNGYHISQHRMHPGKECGYETDINVPMIVRGPNVPAGKTQNIVSSHTDLAPTIMSIAGNDLRETFDGQPIRLDREDQSRPEHLNVEFWGLGVPEGKYGYKGKYMFENGTGNAYVNNTYKSLRIVSDQHNLYYSVWCTNERELYDMNADPDQLHNLLGQDKVTDAFSNHELSSVVDRLDALMMVLKSCKGKSCIDPWREIHPAGNVRSLADALHGSLDVFYKRQPKVRFTQCELGYIRESEGPQDVNVFGFEGGALDSSEQIPFNVDSDWSVMT